MTRKLFAIHAFLFGIIISSSIAQADITSNLVAHWTFDSNFNDSAGSQANNGTGLGNAGITTTAGEWVVGGGSLALDGIGDYVRVNDGGAASEVDGNGNGGVTFAAFVMSDDWKSGNSNILSKGVNGQYRFSLGANGTNIWGLRNDGSGPYEAETVSYTFNENQWYHVATTVNFAEAKVRYYVDGSLVGSALDISENSIQDGSGQLFIGHFAGNLDSEAYNGFMDDLRIYHRVLDPGDINELASLAVPEPTVVAITALGLLAIAFRFRRRNANG